MNAQKAKHRAGAPPSPASILLDAGPEANAFLTHTRAGML
jgi:hypothetical protein